MRATEQSQRKANCLLLALRLPAQTNTESPTSLMLIARCNPSASSVPNAEIESAAPIAQNSATSHDADSPIDQKNTLFNGGPPSKIQSGLGLIKTGQANISRRMVLVALVCWAPLAILAAIQGQQDLYSFFSDFAVHARYLAAVPLLILAERTCIPRINTLAGAFLDAGLVDDADRNYFAAAVTSTRKLLDSIWVEIAVVIAAYLLVVGALYVAPTNLTPAWHRVSGNSNFAPSIAGWWGLLVSLPILLMLQFGWLWRLALWGRFLWLMSRLDLHLVPSHPDTAGGLQFVGYSAQAFMVLGFALGTIAAGSVANGVADGLPFTSFLYFIGGFTASIVVLLNAPLLVFFSNLLRESRRGLIQYEALADRFGREFERKWFDSKQIVDESILERPDFSATTDLYQVIDRVYAMWFVPLHLKSVVLLTIATLLPFVPVALLSIPLDVIISKLASMLL